MSQPTSKPPTPRRCQRILQAHHLRCQGLSLTQIAAAMNCARSTSAAYLRDLRLHHHHILQTLVEDQLLDHIQLLTEPGQEPKQHQQRVATARELRLLLTALPKIEAARERKREQPGSDEPAEEQPPCSQYDHAFALVNGQDRPDNCPDDCEFTKPPYARDLDSPGQTEPDREPSPQISPQSSQIEQNLDKSGLPPSASPAPDSEFSPPAPISRPKPKVGPQYPYHEYDNPFGHAPKPTLEGLLVERHLAGLSPPREYPYFEPLKPLNL